VKRPRWRRGPPRRLYRCPTCGAHWRTERCVLCDPGARLADRLTEARLKSGLAPASAAAGAGLTAAQLTAAELGRLTLLPEELAALAGVYRVPARVFGVGG
jgi:hypothetical protein